MSNAKRKNYSYRELYSKELNWISNKIKGLRKSVNSSQERFSITFNISRSSQLRVENLRRYDSDISVSFLLHQLAALNISPGEFFKDFDSEFNEEYVQKKLSKYLEESDKNSRD